MYWVVFSCCLLVESWVYFILAWYVLRLAPAVPDFTGWLATALYPSLVFSIDFRWFF